MDGRSTSTFRLSDLTRRIVQIGLVMILLATLVLASPTPASAAGTIPTFSIVKVDPGKTVTVQTANFPAGQTFTVRMGAFGTLGIGGTAVGTFDSGTGGAFQATFTIPADLADDARVAIRMDSPQGYYAYNWFDNVAFGTGGPVTTATPGGATPVPATGNYSGIPTFTIQSVVTDTSVTVQTKNFPANQTFTVRMGEFGTLGVGGIVVGTLNSGAGGAFSATFTIPNELKGDYQVAIRMDSAVGFYAYNWFYNSTSGGTGGPVATATPGGATPVPSTGGYTGIPTFSIQSVVSDTSVTVLTNNFPANQTFTVRMGEYGTLGIGGTVIGTINSGAGGAFTATFNIPANLKGRSRIAIRMDSPQGYYAYDWFNNVSGGTGGPVVTATPGATPIPSTGYSGIPTFTISAVDRDASVTIQTKNFPANQTFTVRMGEFGTLAIGGTVVGTIESGTGGAFSATFTIPDGMKGKDQIAIRLDSSAGPYAYNWFWNYDHP